MHTNKLPDYFTSVRDTIISIGEDVGYIELADVAYTIFTAVADSDLLASEALVHSTTDRDHLLQARCHPVAPGIGRAVLTTELKTIWLEKLRYVNGPDAYRIRDEGEHLVLEGVSADEDGYYFTLRLTVEPALT